MSKITARERQLLLVVSECGMNQTHAAKILGISQQAVNKRMKKIKSKINFDELMDEYGLTDDILIHKIKEGLEATKVVNAAVIIKDSQNNGELTLDDKVKIEVPDMATRHKYLETALECKKHVNSDEQSGTKIVNIIYGHRKESEVSDVSRSAAKS